MLRPETRSRYRTWRRASLTYSGLSREDGRLVLRIDPSRAQLVTDLVTSDLKALAQWLGLEPAVRVAEPAES